MKRFLSVIAALLFTPVFSGVVGITSYPYDWFLTVIMQSVALTACGVAIYALCTDETTKLQAALFTVLCGTWALTDTLHFFFELPHTAWLYVLAFVAYLFFAKRLLGRKASRYIGDKPDLPDLVYIVAKPATPWQSLALACIGRPPFIALGIYCNGTIWKFTNGKFVAIQGEPKHLTIRTNRLFMTEYKWLAAQLGKKWHPTRCSCFALIESRFGKLETYLATLKLKAMEL